MKLVYQRITSVELTVKPYAYTCSSRTTTGEGKGAEGDFDFRTPRREKAVVMMAEGMACMTAAVVVIGVLVPFPFYYFLWTKPRAWVNLCGKGIDPSHRMAQVSHILKAVQLISVFSVADLSWMPPWYCVLLFFAGQYLNFK